MVWILSNVLDVDGCYMMEDWNHMMNWWGVPFIGFWWIVVWIVQIIIAFLVYKDAETRENNGLFWVILIIIPWIGFLFLIGYLVIRGEETETMESINKADNVIDERYAKGEISRKEYFEIKKDIEKMRNKK